MSTATPMLCAHCGRPMQSFVQVGSFWYHPECAQSPYAAPQPAEQPEHRQGCDALGGYGHGVGPCSCGAQPGSHGVLHTEQTIPFQQAAAPGYFGPQSSRVASSTEKQPEPSCGWAGCPHGAECVHAKQPEPGGLTDFQRVGLEELAQRIEDANETPIAISPSAAVAMRALLATTRKRSDEEVARIMEAVKLAISNKVSVHEVERLLKGEA